MNRRRVVVLLSFLFLFATAPVVRANLAGVDSGLSARELIRTTESALLREWGTGRPWIRIRGLPDPTNPQHAENVASEREALRELRALGFKPVAFLRWNATSWTNGVRGGGGHRLPLDLREAYARAKRHAEAYGDALAGYEFDNEPDINFIEENAETYAAFLKACYWGVRAADTPPRVKLGATFLRFLSRAGGVAVDSGSRPLAVMAPMALPPGPYFEQLQANGFLSYTDAFNYHYYGHAEDFSGVYRQFEHALGVKPGVGDLKREGAKTVGDGRLMREGEQGDGAGAKLTRRLPVMLTEYGFSGVSGPQRFGAGVRVDQWRWFRSVGEQIRELRIAAPMAFYLRPYFERKVIEFGLTVKPPDAGEGGEPQVEKRVISTAGRPPSAIFRAGGLEFSPEDFGTTTTDPWMRRIGTKVGGDEATPALAWLFETAEKGPYQPRDWWVETATASPVVIDLVAGAGLSQLKRYNGYLLGGPTTASATSEGTAELALYNFSEREVRGRLRWRGENGAHIDGIGDDEVTIAPGVRLLLPVRVRCDAAVLAKAPVSIWFETTSAGVPRALFATGVYPSTSGMQATVLDRFDHGAEAAQANRELLLKRPRASDERALVPVGRWLTTPHVRVEESPGGRWRLIAMEFGLGPRTGRATVELPLRDDFVFPDEAGLRLAYRLAAVQGGETADGVFFEIYFRTANGTLYVVWPWALARSEWGNYLELKTNFSPMFQSRANLPWAFARNRPVSLVFSFYAPGVDGATIEIHQPEIVRIAR